jgi:hypothetical protein
MPINKKMTMGKIIETEMKAGRPQKQAEAIAYSVKGASKTKKKGKK